MKRMMALLILLGLLLSGCSYWMNGSYSSVEPHIDPANHSGKPAVNVGSYEELVSSLAAMVENGAESGILSIQYDAADARVDMDKAIREVRQNNPFAIYAVEDIGYVLGASGSRKAVSLQINYLQNRERTNTIQRVQSLAQVEQAVAQRLDACATELVLYLENQEQLNFAKMVADYSLLYPQRVMESPEVVVNLYPEQGEKQIVELKFIYQSSQAQLRTLQNRVAPVFSSAFQFVAGEWTTREKAERLYNFLMERYEYSIQPSITPAYSLLLHGEGDSRAFAMVYAAMCRQAKMECRVVSGTRQGEQWTWNAILIDGAYYYLDLLRCNDDGGFALHTQEEMVGYGWDQSAFVVQQEKTKK